MFEIRPEIKKDILQITEVNNLAFGRTNESKLIDAIRMSEFFIPDLSLVAVTNKVIGHILFSYISIRTKNSIIQTIGLAPMAVHPDFQNKGVGSALVREGLTKCNELGFEHVFVLGHPNFYPKFGFIPTIKKGIRSPFDVPDDVFMVFEIKNGSLTNRSGVVEYPPAFNNV